MCVYIHVITERYVKPIDVRPTVQEHFFANSCTNHLSAPQTRPISCLVLLCPETKTHTHTQTKPMLQTHRFALLMASLKKLYTALCGETAFVFFKQPQNEQNDLQLLQPVQTETLSCNVAVHVMPLSPPKKTNKHTHGTLERGHVIFVDGGPSTIGAPGPPLDGDPMRVEVGSSKREGRT